MADPDTVLDAVDAWDAGREYGLLEAELARRPHRPPFRPIRARNRAAVIALAAQYGYQTFFADDDGSGWTTLHLYRVVDDDAPLEQV